MDLHGFFTVSHKIFDGICINLRMEICRTISYGAMSFNFIERKESLFYILIFRLFWYFLLKYGEISLKSHPGEFQ
jgi:hypothetical protein